jgi:hypothetical protein
MDASTILSYLYKILISAVRKMEISGAKKVKQQGAKEYFRLFTHSLPLGTLCQWFLELPTLEDKANILDIIQNRGNTPKAVK